MGFFYLYCPEVIGSFFGMKKAYFVTIVQEEELPTSICLSQKRHFDQQMASI